MTLVNSEDRRKAFFFIFIFSFLFPDFSFSQQLIAPNTPLDNSAELFIKKVQTSSDLLYRRVIDIYDESLAENKSVYVQIEECRFINKVFLNEDNYYNPKYDEFENCLEELIDEYPNQTDALIYHHYYQYEETSKTILEDIVSQAELGIHSSKVKFLWMAYEDLANHYSNLENPAKSLLNATLAKQENDTLDLSVLMANQYIALEREKDAVEVLVSYLDSTKTYNLYQKGDLLFKVGEHEKALKVFKWLEDSNEGWDLSEELGKVFTRLERYSEARPYLHKASNSTWNQRKSLEVLYHFDLEHSPPDTLAHTYNLMRDRGYMADPFGIFKLMMITNRGVVNFQLRDMVVILSYLTLLILILAIPYLWILPIYSYGKWKVTNSIRAGTDPPHSRWGLKHFWYISSLILFASFSIQIILNYPELS